MIVYHLTGGNGKVTSVLEIWAKQGSIAIIQMLPKWMWKRTALGRASEVRLRGLTPGVFNQNLIAKEVSLWDELDEERGVKVPVFTLEADHAVTWALMLSGKGSIWVSGYVFKLDIVPVKKESSLLNFAGDLSAEHRVQAFRVTASPMARKLAGLLASAPVITLPIVRLIQEALLKDSLQVNVAEVFLGGLLKPLSEINAETNPDYVQYDFMDGVRDLLLDSVPSNYTLTVINEVSKYVAKKMELSLDNFAAVLKNEQLIRNSEIVEDVGYFATVTAQILRRLGGEYVKVAEELESYNQPNYKINVQTTVKKNYNLLWEHKNTKIYSFCTDQPWVLPFDTLVIPMGCSIFLHNKLLSGGGFSKGFQHFLGKNIVLFDQSVAMALGEDKNNQKQVSPNKPLLVPLASEINHQLSLTNGYKINHFVIITTVESPEPSVLNAVDAINSIIALAVKQGLKYIIVPLLGTGNIGLSVDKVATEMLSAINKSLKNLSSNSIEEIIFVDKSENTITKINQIAQSLFTEEDTDQVQQPSELFRANPEPRIPVVLILDTSGSMSGQPINELNQGLVTFQQELNKDDSGSMRVEVAIITFNTSVTIVQDFVRVDQFKPPCLSASGVTAMGEAIETAISLLEYRKETYKNNGVRYYRPWVLLITDGSPTDNWQSAAKKIRQFAVQSKNQLFCSGCSGRGYWYSLTDCSYRYAAS